jgi:hypothetical protein
MTRRGGVLHAGIMHLFTNAAILELDEEAAEIIQKCRDAL